MAVDIIARAMAASAGKVTSVNGKIGAVTLNANDVNAISDTFVTSQTTAPTAAATDGGIHLVYLTSEPSTKYDGYIYLIKEA